MVFDFVKQFLENNYLINQLLKFLEKVHSVRFHSLGQYLYKFIGTKVSANIRKEFNPPIERD